MLIDGHLGHVWDRRVDDQRALVEGEVAVGGALRKEPGRGDVGVGGSIISFSLASIVKARRRTPRLTWWGHACRRPAGRPSSPLGYSPRTSTRCSCWVHFASRFGRRGCAFTFIHTPEDQKMLDETVGHFKCEVKEADIEDPEDLEELVKNAQKAPKAPK